jgi:hypothetical protein
VELEHAQKEGVTMGGEEASNQLPEAFDIWFTGHTVDTRKVSMMKRWTQRNTSGPQLVV